MKSEYIHCNLTQNYMHTPLPEKGKIHAESPAIQLIVIKY